MAGVASKDIWRERVLAWHTSGVRSEEFCSGQGFSAGLLRHWAWRLGLKRGRLGDKAKNGRTKVRLARVIRTKGPQGSGPCVPSRGLWIEIGRARIEVHADVDAAALATVLAVLEQHEDGKGGSP